LENTPRIVATLMTSSFERSMATSRPSRRLAFLLDGDDRGPVQVLARGPEHFISAAAVQPDTDGGLALRRRE
jgi:hypothetical protein